MIIQMSVLYIAVGADGQLRGYNTVDSAASRVASGDNVYRLEAATDGTLKIEQLEVERVSEPVTVERQVVRLGGEVVTSIDVVRRPKPAFDPEPKPERPLKEAPTPNPAKVPDPE